MQDERVAKACHGKTGRKKVRKKEGVETEGERERRTRVSRDWMFCRFVSLSLGRSKKSDGRLVSVSSRKIRGKQKGFPVSLTDWRFLSSLWGKGRGRRMIEPSLLFRDTEGGGGGGLRSLPAYLLVRANTGRGSDV